MDLFLIRSGTPADGPFVRFADALKSEISGITFHTVDKPSADMPGIGIRGNLVWHALPEGPEKPPFLEAIRMMADDTATIPDELARTLSQINTPAEVSVYITPACPFCPRAVSKILPLALLNDDIFVRIIDGILFPEKANALNIKSTPTTVLDDTYQWTGQGADQPPVGEIVQMIIRRDPANLGPVALQTLISGGNAKSLAEMMIRAGKIFPAFMDVLMHEKWPVRLGAMVAAEYLAQASPDLAETLLVRIRERFESVPLSVQGDLIHTAGEIGNTTTRGWLEKIRIDTGSRDLREAAGEAVAAIDERRTSRHAGSQ